MKAREILTLFGTSILMLAAILYALSNFEKWDFPTKVLVCMVPAAVIVALTQIVLPGIRRARDEKKVLDRSWDMLIHAWHIFATEQWNKGTDISNTERDFNDCVARNAPKTACEILANAILHRSIVKKATESLKCYDKFGEELQTGDIVDVQQAGCHAIYKKKDGHLYFKPYGEEERVKDYFSNDLIKVSKAKI